jgi:hypothetical protein
LHGSSAALVLGRPLVVSDIGWFSELPDEVVAKVPADAWEIDLLTVVLARLAGADSGRELREVAGALREVGLGD